MHTKGIAAALVAGFWLGSVPAAAVDDLTGVYAAKLSCKGIDSGVKGKQKVEANFYVVDQGTGSVLFEFGAYGPGQAFLLTETAKPDNGVLSGMNCSKNASDLFGVVIRFDVNSKKADPVLKGTVLIFEDSSGESATCKFTGKRVSLEPGKIAGCAG
jgi:hypothetical protein